MSSLSKSAQLTLRLADAGDELLGNLVSLSADCWIKRLLNGLKQFALFIGFA